MFKNLIALLLISTQAFAGLPPTTSKASGDSSNITTFNYQFPNFAVTHTGVTAVFGVLGYAGGGTNAASASAGFNNLWNSVATTGFGTLLYQGSSNPLTLSPNITTTNKVLTEVGNGSAATTVAWTDPATLPAGVLAPYTINLTSGTAATFAIPYYFIVTAATATAGATYTNNSQTFTLVNSGTSATTLLFTSTGAPLSSGTLTKASGTGDATITFSATRAPLYLHVRGCGGGGGGAGSTTGAASSGGGGGTTTFGTSLLSATGGGGGGANVASVAGGTATITAPAYGVPQSGNPGGAVVSNLGSNSGGFGGSSPFGGAGPSIGGTNAGAGSAAAVNSCSGGGGGGTPGGYFSGGGGTSAGYFDATVPNPSATYTYTIGAAGTAGTGVGVSGQNGGAGGTGFVTVDCHWQ